MEQVVKTTPLYRGLWFDFLAAPIAYIIQDYLGSAFVGLACGGPRWPMYLVSVLAILVAIAGLVRSRQVFLREEEPRAAHFMAASALILNGLFLFLALATTVGIIWLEPCRLR